MKRSLKYAVIMVMALLFSLSANAKKNEGQGQICFATTTHDFGTIKEDGGSVTCEFEFTNNGDGNISVVDAKAQCGCTRPSYPTSPIKPGKKGKIKVTYNPMSRPGSFSKTVTVNLYNCNKKKVTLKIKGTVLPKSEK